MKTIIKILIVILITLSFAELSLRIVESYTPKYAPGNESGGGIRAKALTSFLQAKIYKLWDRKPEERTTILEPPFQVFVNKNFEDKERMDLFISMLHFLPEQK